MLGERKLEWPKTLSQEFVSSEGTAAISVVQQRRWEEKVSRVTVEEEKRNVTVGGKCNYVVNT